jgi:uncharacterized membrane protein YbhN (UPF0104 family)
MGFPDSDASAADRAPEVRARAATRLAVLLVKLTVAAALIAWLVDSGRLDLGLLVRVPVSPPYLLGILALLAGTLLIAVRWWGLLRAQDIPLTLGQAIRLSWIGQFFAVVLPGATGGEIVRAYYILRAKPGATVAAVSTLLADRLLGLYALLWLGLGSLGLMAVSGSGIAPAAARLGLVSLGLLGGLSLALWVLWWSPTRGRVLRLLPPSARPAVAAMLEAYGAQPRVLLAGLGISLVANGTYVASFALASRALGQTIPGGVFFLVVPLVTIANSVPLTPGGIGVAETTASLLFAPFGVTTGASLMLLVRLWLMLLRLPGALFYVTRPR